MNWHTCESLLNTSGRAAEQLAGCLAKQAKVSSRGQSRTASAKVVLSIFNEMMSKRVFPFSRQ